MLRALLTGATLLCAAPAFAAPGACRGAEGMQAAGMDSARLCELLASFSAGSANFHGLVIERHGTVVAEAYRRGADKKIGSLFSRTVDFDANQRHDLRSISKSVTSLLWGIAEAQGKTPPLDTSVLALLPEARDLANAGRATITLEQLFTMTSGLAWRESYSNPLADDEFGLSWRSSQARYLFDRPMASAPGARFNYNGGSTAALAQILAARTGMPLPELARRYLFEPLGITDWEWVDDMRGRPLAYAGLRMRPRDLARIGRMILDHGRWNGRQIVPAAWLERSLQRRIDTGDGLRYGYQWWAGKTAALGATHDWNAGFGNGGQRLFMTPGLDLVVVITAGDYGKPEIGREANALFRRIAATVVKQ